VVLPSFEHGAQMGAALSHLCKNVRASDVGETREDRHVSSDCQGISSAPADEGGGAHRQRSQLMRIRKA
jgi:hypothetical protein